ncbi:MAG: DUF3106 domain-containing protein [Chromatiales bacterium]|nr:DUF3106 domain-containing protein [Chromatiales bacterium]
MAQAFCAAVAPGPGAGVAVRGGRLARTGPAAVGGSPAAAEADPRPAVGRLGRHGGLVAKKWIGIANRYPAMSEEEQARVQRRMKKWAVLTPDERRKARDQYRKLQNISPDQREQLRDKWQEYANLPDEEKKRLKESAAARAKGKAATSKSGRGRGHVQTGRSRQPRRSDRNAGTVGAAHQASPAAPVLQPEAAPLNPDRPSELRP